MFAVFGPYDETDNPLGLGILAEADGVGGITRDDVLFSYRAADGTVVPDLASADAIQIDLHLANNVSFEVPVDFSSALPGLGLDVDATLNLGVGFDFQFGFGVSISDLFYFDVSRENELVAGLSATFDAGDEINLALGFLSFGATDLGNQRPAGYGPNFVDWSDFGALGTGLTGSGIVGAFHVDLRNKEAEDRGDTADAQRLSALEIGSGPDQNPLTGPNGVIEAGIKVRAEADLDMGLEIGEGGQFPSISTEFHFEWEFESILIGGPVDPTTLGSAPTIEFLAVSLDLGGFISDVLGPILTQVQKVTEPLEPIIEILQMRIPGISDLAGEDVTLLDLAGTFGGNSFDPALIKTLIDIVEVINALPSEGTDIIIGFGDFVVGGVDLRSGASLSGATNPTSTIDLDAQVSNPTGRKKGGGVSTDDPTAKAETQGFLSKLGNLGGSGLSLPILTSPSNVFGLLTGKVVDLVVWDIPNLHVQFDYDQSFIIAPGLNARFGGTLYAHADLQLGFDTRGISQFTAALKAMPPDVERALYITSQVPKIFLGLYFGDHIDSDGTDQPELEFGAGITAGASVGIGGLVEAGVEGGLFAEIEFDWHDTTKDGKVYIDELAERFLLSPFAIFDTSGDIYAQLNAFLWVGVKVFGAQDHARRRIFRHHAEDRDRGLQFCLQSG